MGDGKRSGQLHCLLVWEEFTREGATSGCREGKEKVRSKGKEGKTMKLIDEGQGKVIL